MKALGGVRREKNLNIEAGKSVSCYESDSSASGESLIDEMEDDENGIVATEDQHMTSDNISTEKSELHIGNYVEVKLQCKPNSFKYYLATVTEILDDNNFNVNFLRKKIWEKNNFFLYIRTLKMKVL